MRPTAGCRGPSGFRTSRRSTRATPSAWSPVIHRQALSLRARSTIGEIRRGVVNIRQRDVPTARALDRWLRSLLRDHAHRILDIDQRVAEEWGRLNVPDPLPAVDGLLAATARVHDLTLVTRNVKDVVRTGIDVVNPFEPMSGG